MAAATETGKRGWLARHWVKLTAVALALSGSLGWYDAVRNKGRLFLCDVTAVVGQDDALSLCRVEEVPPDTGDQLALLEYLKTREDRLSPDRLALLRRLEAHFEERAFAKLMEAAGLEQAPGEEQAPADARAEVDAREAVRETIEQGNAEERRALAMIVEGDVDGGLQLLTDLASASALENAAEWRRIGRLAYAADTARALEAYEKVVALDRSDPGDAIYLGRLYHRSGALDEARRTFVEALARLPETEKRDRAVLSSEIGDVLRARGDLGAALSNYRKTHEFLEALAASDPSNAVWQRDLSVSHDRIGDVLSAQGRLDDAVAAYRAGLSIREALAAADPSNAGWQRDLSVSYNKVGDVLRAQGRLDDVVAAYRAGLAIAEALAAADSSNAGWQRDLSVSHNKVGDVLSAQGRLDHAEAAYRASLEIAEALAAADPSNAGWQTDLVVSCVKVAQVVGQAPDRKGEARRLLQRALGILRRLDAEGLLHGPQRQWIDAIEEMLAGGD